MSKYVTRTGRAVSPGKVTRASHLVRTRQRNQERPLPIELQCHPKHLTPTPRHPMCKTVHMPQGARAMYLAHSMTRQDFLGGVGLEHGEPKPRYVVMYEDNITRVRLGYTDDIVYAMAWRLAASMHLVYVDVEDTKS